MGGRGGGGKEVVVGWVGGAWIGGSCIAVDTPWPAARGTPPHSGMRCCRSCCPQRCPRCFHARVTPHARRRVVCDRSGAGWGIQTRLGSEARRRVWLWEKVLISSHDHVTCVSNIKIGKLISVHLQVGGTSGRRAQGHDTELGRGNVVTQAPRPRQLSGMPCATRQAQREKDASPIHPSLARPLHHCTRRQTKRLHAGGRAWLSS